MKLDVKSICLCALFTALIAIGAFIKIPISIVPITLQTLFVVLAGIILGKRLAFISVSLYIVVGLIGIPIFANGGGPAYTLQPTFGYLIGFLLAAYIVGYVSERRTSFTSILIISLLAMVLIYIVGMIYFIWIQKAYYGVPYTWGWTMYYMFLVYLPGDILSCILASFVGKRLKKIVKR